MSIKILDDCNLADSAIMV